MNNILITGAASGIGKATAIFFKRKGWQVGLLDIDSEALADLSAQLEGAWYSAVDVTDYTQVQQAISDFAALHDSQLRVLFNCAGVLHMGHFEQLTPEQHHKTLAININGLVNVIHAAFPFLRHTENAQVINMSSAAALYGAPHMASFSAAKFAVRGLTEALDLEWSAYNIRVMDVLPLFVQTNMVNNMDADSIKNMGVHLTAEDVAQTIYQAADYQGKIAKVHWTVGLPTRLFYAVSGAAPDWLSRGINQFINRQK